MIDPAKMKLINYDYAKYGASAERRRLIARWEKDVQERGALRGGGVGSSSGGARTHRTTVPSASVNRPLWVWVVVGVLGYLVLPWYAQQDANGLLAVGQVFSGEQAPTG